MNLVTPEFQDLIVRLIDELQPEDCADSEAYRLAKELNALPIGQDFTALIFLKPNGEVVWYDFDPGELGGARDLQSLIRGIVSAAKRYPQFEKFIPSRPANAEVCPACNGTKLWGTNVSTGQLARCVFCAGLGWTVKTEQK